MIVDELKAYKKFTTSYYVNEGFRITAAVMIPVLLSSYLGHLAMGITFVLGALCVSSVDTPGPMHHRRNAMRITILLIFLGAIIVGFTVRVPWLLAILLALSAFTFSMIGVYGLRASSIGAAALLLLVLNIDDNYTTKEIFVNAGLVGAGGIWYFLWSLLLNRLRPYKLAQQAIGDSILSLAKYTRIKASLYNKNVDYEKTYKTLLEEQVHIHTKQNLVREVLFKTRSIVKETTHTGRVLLMTFLDSVDLFERIMTSQQDYKALQDCFDDDMLHRFQEVILKLASELENIGIALQEGTKSVADDDLTKALEELKTHFADYRHQHLNETNIEGFISLRHILDSIVDIRNRLLTMHRYTRYDKNLNIEKDTALDYNQFISHTDISTRQFFTNINFHSNIFRHSLRVSLAMLAGFFLSKALAVGHGYWILLTILVILKPAYSLTKQRNFQRLTGTVIGAVIGATTLYFLKDRTVVLVVLMIIGMLGAYSLLRLQYFIAVIFMTFYILLAFYFLKHNEFQRVIQDRVIDTAIGSAVAFAFVMLIPPKWEHEQIKKLLTNCIKANAVYFEAVARVFTGKEFNNFQYKFFRKESFVALSNLSDAFQRMLSEPRSKQKNSMQIYQLTVSNHILASHIATLASYVFSFAQQHVSLDFLPLVDDSISHFDNTIAILEGNSVSTNDLTQIQESKYIVRNKVEDLLSQRVQELKAGSFDTDTRHQLSQLKTITDQFEYIHKISIDIEKIAGKFDTP
ncbi:FUSC family protein [Pinibacter soli]|uniref:FUSC family membrane protein n=1 Tax=Pinibacter soli TaxID=3044211 RepID=A0ABT6RCM3_9BACT|nr:FUSC family membrane protein [Pinibacter soli]MDI3320319.1 FUSC family membrane protein [Pinibacter soli]